MSDENQIATAPAAPTGPSMGMVIETNYEKPATVEQPKAPEMSTTIPKTESELLNDGETKTVEPVKASSEPAKVEPTAEEIATKKANDEALERQRERIRTADLERQVNANKPKLVTSDVIPDITDQKTWGEKYQSEPNNLETFLKARDEYMESQGEKKAQTAFNQAEQQRKNLELQAKVATRDASSRAKHTDFDAVITSVAPLLGSNPILRSFLISNEMGSEVGYELGKNPAILEQVLKSEPWAAGEQLLAMAARLKKPMAVKQSNASEPIKPVGSRETLKPSLAKLATDDINGYVEKMNATEIKMRKYRK